MIGTSKAEKLDEIRQQREELQKQLAAIVAALQRLELLEEAVLRQSNGERSQEEENAPTDGGNCDGRFTEGARVIVTRRDHYYGRQGVIISPHGKLFWNVRLDRDQNSPAQIIYKMPSGLRLLSSAK